MRSPPARILPARPTRVAPYIYTDQKIEAPLGAANTLQPELRAATYRTLIALMAATGIRTGEALGLDMASFDPQGHTLTVTGKIRQDPPASTAPHRRCRTERLSRAARKFRPRGN